MFDNWPEPIRNLPPLRAVIADNDLAAKKSLGQNFLLDLNITNKIARAAGDVSDVTVVEIGPGPGGLTRALLANGAARVVAVERDRRCVQALQPLVQAADGRLQVIEDDAMRVDVLNISTAPRAVVANLPYNIGTELLIGWLRNAGAFTSLTLMFQKEVAERVVAKPSTKAYGRLAVLAQATTIPKIVMLLPPQAFTPPPKVHSAVLQLHPLAEPLAPLPELERVTAAAFGQRRKMVKAGLAPLFTETELRAHGIDPQLRAENLPVTQFCALAKALANRA
jgi:16S rRNA (adenine1518-N6/adenine1519-N6)-dimethyltransferase